MARRPRPTRVPPPPRFPGRRTAVLTLVPLLLAATTALTGCGSKHADAQGPIADDTVPVTSTIARSSTTAGATTSSATSSTVARPTTPEDQVKAAYLEAARILDRAFAASDPDDPGLASTQVNPSLAAIRATLTRRRELGQIARYPGDIAPEQRILHAELRSSNEAALVVCVIDNAVLTDSHSGKVLDSDVVSRKTNVKMNRVGETWKIKSIELTSMVDGDQGCDR